MEVSAEHRTPTLAQAQQPLLAVRLKLHVIITNEGFDPGTRLSHRTRFHGHGRMVADHHRAGFRLPPGIIDLHLEDLSTPVIDLRVQRFSHAVHSFERGEIMLGELVFILLHQHAQRCGRGVPDVDLEGLQCF